MVISHLLSSRLVARAGIHDNRVTIAADQKGIKSDADTTAHMWQFFRANANEAFRLEFKEPVVDQIETEFAELEQSLPL